MTPTRNSHTLSYPEYLSLKSAAPEHRRPYLALLAGAGLTPTELEKVIAQDFDPHEGDLRVRGRSRRVVPVHPAIALMLSERAANGPPDALLFPCWHNIRRQLPLYCRRAGVPVIVPRQLQASFLNWLAERGVAEGVAHDLVGRGSSRLVIQVYRNETTHRLRSAIAQLPTP